VLPPIDSEKSNSAGGSIEYDCDPQMNRTASWITRTNPKVTISWSSSLSTRPYSGRIVVTSMSAPTTPTAIAPMTTPSQKFEITLVVTASEKYAPSM